MIKFIKNHLGVKIALGYLATIVLMLFFGIFTINSQQKITLSFTDVTQKMGNEKTFSQEIVSNLAYMLSYSSKYALEPTQENIDNFYFHYNLVNSYLANADKQISDPSRRENVDQIRTDLQQYGNAFEEIVIHTQDNQLIEMQVLNVQEIIIDNKLIALRIYLNFNENQNHFLLYSNAITAFQSLRLDVQKYRRLDDEKYAVLTSNDYQAALGAFVELRTHLQDTTQIQNVTDAITALDAYINGFSTIQENQAQIRELRSEQIDVLDPKISLAVQEMDKIIRAEFEQRTLESQELTNQTRKLIGVFFISLILISLVFSVVFSFRITRPLRQVMVASKQIANTDLSSLSSEMASLSQGNTHVNLEISTAPILVTLTDEVGQMANAFNEIIFRLIDTKVSFDQMVDYLNEKSEAATEIALGNLSTEIDVRSEQDILSMALVNMVQNLDEAQQKLMNQLARLNTLYKIDNMIATNQDLQSILLFLVEQAVVDLGMTAGNIQIVDETTGQISKTYQSGQTNLFSDRKIKKAFSQSAQQAMDEKKVIYITLPGSNGGINTHNIGCYSAPLIAQGKPRGILQLFANTPLGLDDDWKSFFDTLAGQAAIAINNHDLVHGLEERVKQRTNELAQQQKYYQAIVNHSPVAIIVIDREINIVSWNPAAETLFGYKAEEVIGQNAVNIIAKKEYYEETVNLFERSKTEYLHLLTNRYRKDGNLVAVEIFSEPVRIEDKHVGTLFIYHDITELQNAKQSAEEATRIKSEFLANMSHEIRTPMNGVMGMTSLLMDTNLTKKQRDYVDTIRISSESLLSIVNDILDFSKIEAGRMELDEQPFNLRDCIETALDLIAHQAATKQLELIYKISTKVPQYVYGDETRIRQIFVNLLSNAVKFTDEGEIVVNVSRENGNDHSIVIPDNHSLFHFTVKDTGLGIPPDRQNRLFLSFSQVDASTTRKYGGTGLGLTICKKLTEMMGGKIWVESQGIPGKGSNFHFLLPLREADAPQKHDDPMLYTNLIGKRVLIVDDNATNCEILGQMIQKWKMIPTAYTKPEEALMEISSGKIYDLAIFDVQMPGMNGIQLAEEVRKQLDPSELPIIFLSSLGTNETKSESISPAAYLQKPIKSSILYNVLINTCSEHPVRVSPTSTDTKYSSHLAQEHPLHILLAEDHVVNQKVALLTLERLGYRADTVSNGLEVLQALNRQTYDVVLMDIQMPELDGIETTKELRKTLPANKQPWIIALTANALVGDRELYLEAGMDDYLSKPFHIDQLGSALKKVKIDKTAVENHTEQQLQKAEHVTSETPNVPDRILEHPSEEMPPPPIDLHLLNDYFPGFEKDVSILSEVVKMFIEDTPVRLIKLRQAIESYDIETTRITAHSLKGASLTFGAVHLSELSKGLEMIARSGTLERATDSITQIEAEYERVEMSLKDLIGM